MFPFNLIASVINAPVPSATSSKSLLVTFVFISFEFISISSTCKPFKFNPVMSAVPTIELFTVKIIVLLVGCAVTDVLLSDDLTPPKPILVVE